jgi:hypothetical protein
VAILITVAGLSYAALHAHRNLDQGLGCGVLTMLSLKWVVRIVLLVLAVLALLSIPRPSASAQQDEDGVKSALVAAPAP